MNLRFLLCLALTPAVRAADVPAYPELLKIDAHSHIFEDAPAINAVLREANLRTINLCVPGGDGHLEEMSRIAVDLYRKHPET